MPSPSKPGLEEEPTPPRAPDSIAKVLVAHRPTGERDQLVIRFEAATMCVAVVDDVRDHHPRLHAVFFLVLDDRPEAGVVGIQTGAEVAQEVLDLVHGNRVANTRVDSAALFERDPAVDPNQLPVHVE